MKGMGTTAIGAFFVAFVIEIVILCCRNCARRVPMNYFLLLAFTACQAFYFAHVCSHYPSSNVISAASMASVITIGLTIYACTASTDFTVYGSLFFLISLSLMCLMVISSVMTFAVWWHPFISVMLVVVYGLYIVYDT